MAGNFAAALAMAAGVSMFFPLALVTSTTAPPDGGDSAPPDTPALTPLRSDPALVPLAVDGFADAVVSVPQGVTSPRPVVIAAHGKWDAPDGLCDAERWVFGDRVWVVCPRGKPTPDGKAFRFESAHALAREIDADLRALAARYPGYVDEDAMLYVGFSLGANFGVAVIASDPERFPRAVLIEGGDAEWTPALASEYAAGGGERVLFACGLRARVPVAQRAAKLLDRAGVEARVVLGQLPEKGEFIHWYNGPVAEEVRAAQPWLFEGDPRWAEAEGEQAR